MLQNRSILKKHSRRLRQTVVVFLTFLLVFSGLIPNTFSQAVHVAEGLSTNNTVHAEEVTNNKNTVTKEKNKILTHKFDKFSKDTISQLFSLNGAAEVPGGANFIRLTPPSPMQSGAAFNKTKICPKNNYSFSTAFSFKMSNTNPAGASDGLTFTIQGGTSSFPVEGGSIGYYNIKPSFTVKYDTFQNTVYSDPSSNYIGIAENGGLVNQPGWYTDLNQYNTNNGTNYVLLNGTQYYTWIDYDGLSRNVQVLLGTSSDRASAKKVLDVGNIDLGTIFNGQPYHAGFTAATGYPNYETHDIHSWYFANNYAPIETLNPNNDYKQAPSSVKLTTGSSDKPGVYDVTVILQDPLGNPVAGASLDTLTSTGGQLTGPNGESVTDLVSDADGKIHAVLKGFDHSKDTTVSVTVGCATDSKMMPAANQPPTAPDDTKTIPINTPVSGKVNGTDPDGDNLTYHTGSKQPNHGTVVVNNDGTWTYTPGKDYVGDDSFTVSVDDGHGGTTESTIVIHVKPTPVLESKKEASIQQKAEGNKDATHPEVGDTLLYTIQTRNTTLDSSVKNAGIEDQLPEGLEYVPGTLQVDGKSVTDAEGDDNGHYIQGKVIGKLGDITNADWHSVIFYAKVKADQAGKEIQNTAKVTGDNVPPQEPSTKVIINLKEAKLESKKTAKNLQDKNIEVGDEIEYTIQTRNTISDSIVKNVAIEDQLPEGLEYVPGTLQVNGQAVTDAEADDNGQYIKGKVTGKLNDITDTEWHTVVFHAKVKAGQAGKEIQNTAKVTGDNVPPQEPSTKVPVNPKEAKLESKKTAKNLQDKNIEVGDEIKYTIQMRNTISDSIVKNVVIEDQLPEGLEYVPGTLQVNGKPVTDTAGDDTGHYVQGKVTGKLGDITGTEWHTVVFHVKVKDGQAGKNIQNTANVTGDGVPPQEPTTEITVQSLGQIEIEKVDAIDSNVKLKNAVFQILDKDGKEVGKVTTDGNGKATSDPLRFGTYTLKEIQAPTGYMLLRDPVVVKVSSPVQKIKVENTKNEWDIPNTGGIGTTLFYLIGTILMVATLVVFFRRRNS
ncbi:isopeptide-forming domain-containing fimbrial protein [Bacillus paramycoides]|uniref:isopeptide-forming domain-containing fimbrial protein n=1 Tax=Bacillus paramycoides TaxID=2026194 RepID=UPI002E234D4A|nr:isopeptide-forming domain-containing fimbrial protein [Bacillus paramycoides]